MNDTFRNVRFDDDKSKHKQVGLHQTEKFLPAEDTVNMKRLTSK